MTKIKNFEEFYGIEALDIIKKFNLGNYLKIVIKESKSNNAPYHNLNHVLCMVKNIYIICNNEDVKKEDIQTLIIAALFHDFNHSQGKKTDDENIKIAIKACNKYIEEENLRLNVIDIIKATQYPYVIDEKDLSKNQLIIRDCDMLQTFESNFIQQVLLGLSTELGIELEKFLDMQLSFLDNLKFHTKTAKELTKGKISKIKKDVNYLKSIL